MHDLYILAALPSGQTNYAETDKYIVAKGSLSIVSESLTDKDPLLGLYAVMPLASFSPYQPNDDHWAAAISANPPQRPISCSLFEGYFEAALSTKKAPKLQTCCRTTTKSAFGFDAAA